MKRTRGFAKGIYYSILGPLYLRLKAEAADESREICAQQMAQLTEESERLRKESERLVKELERLKKLSLEQQGHMAQQVADEFVKMYSEIEDIKSDRTDIKLNVTLVNELIKIHQSLEVLKQGSNHGSTSRD